MNILILFLIVLSIATAGIVFRRKQPMAVPPNAKANDLLLEACQYKTKSTTYRAERGTLIVPENRLAQASRLIALPVKRIHSLTNTPREPIFYLGGGPGMSNMRFQPPDDLLASHDVVLVGYRGVDGSAVLDCSEFSKATLGDGRDVFSDTSLAMMTDAIHTCRARMEAAGVDISGYTMQQVVEDLEVVRSALGYERIDLLSESYGTRVAQVYASLYPGHLYRSAMIGVNPPGRFVWEPEMVDAQIEHYGRLWTKDERARARAGNLAETMRNVSQNMPRRWLFFPIDPGKVKAMSFVLFFNRKTSAMVFDAYIAAAHGDASGLALLSLAYNLFVPKSFVWGDFFAKGGSADLDLNRNYTADLRAPDSILGSPISLLIWSPLSQAWPKDKQVELNAVQPNDVETLLVSGSIDFSTPAEYAAQELLPFLQKGKQVIIFETGHVGDVWNVQPEATRHLLVSFYDTGIADDSLYQYEPMNFTVQLGFPMIAKILLGTGLLGVIGLFAAASQLQARNGKRKVLLTIQNGST